MIKHKTKVWKPEAQFLERRLLVRECGYRDDGEIGAANHLHSLYKYMKPLKNRIKNSIA